MDTNKLPVVYNKNMGMFSVLKDTAKKYFNKISTQRKNKEIISKLTNVKTYDVLSMPAFKYYVDKIVKDNKNGTIIMGDINDLFVANQNKGKDNVNQMIKEIIDNMKNVLEEEKQKDYKMAKMGDEIYIYLKNNNPDDIEKIMDKMKEIKNKELTLSIGKSTDLSKGLFNSTKEAEQDMSKYKAEFKNDRLKHQCGGNLDKIADTVVKSQIDKMRIDLNNLKESNKSDLKNTFSKAINTINKDDLNSYSHKNIINNEINDFELLKSKYSKEAQSIYGDNKELIDEYVLANLLSRHTVDDTITNDFFQKIEHEKVFKNIKKDKNSTDIDIIAVDLVGLKNVNDKYGYEEGDKVINNSTEYFKNTIEKLKIPSYSNVVVKDGGISYIVTKKLSDNEKEKLLTKLQQYHDSSEYNTSIACTTETIDKNELKKLDFIETFNKNLTKLEKNLKNVSYSNKITDVEGMKNAIMQVYSRVLTADDLYAVSSDNVQRKKCIFEKIQQSFSNYIQSEKGEINTRTPEIKPKEKEDKNQEPSYIEQI